MKVEVVNPDEEKDSAKDAAVDPVAQDASQDEATVADQAAEAAPADEAGDEVEADATVIDDPVDSDDEVFSLEDLRAARAAAKEASDRCVRLEAEWDNFRKRTAREREEERARAAESLVTKLLPVVDDLERALDHAATAQPEGAFSQFVDGIQAVHTKLVGVFEKAGVSVIDPAGEPFNMHEQQAVGHVDDPSAYDETVRDVYQKGYRMGGRVIRPAMVTVTKGGPRRPAEAADAKGEA